MTSFTWTGGGDGTTWGDQDNWDTHTVPNAADADVTFSNRGSLIVGLTANVDIGNLTIIGDSQVQLKANGGDYTLDVKKDTFTPPATDPNTYGHIKLDQRTGKTASLTVAGNATDILTLKARDLEVVSSASPVQHGSSELTVNSAQKAEFSEDIIANGFKFDLTVHGDLSAHSALLMGKGTGNEDKSYGTIFGKLTVSEELRIGGTGTTVFAVEMGTVTCDFFQVVNGSSLNLISNGTVDARNDHRGQLTFHKPSNVGDAVGFSEAAGLNDIAATIEIRNGGDLKGDATTAHLTVAGGNGIRIDTFEGTMNIDGTMIINGAADANKTGPTVVCGTADDVTYRRSFIDNIWILNSDDKPSGVLQVDAELLVSGTVKLWSQFRQARSLVKVNGYMGATNWGLTYTTADGYSNLHAAAGSVLEIGHATTGGSMTIGGNGCNAVFQIDRGAVVNQLGGATVTKDIHAYIQGEGGVGLSPTLTAAAANYNKTVLAARAAMRINGVPIVAPKPLADLMPGDYYNGADDYGMPIVNESSSEPFGTLKFASLLSNTEEANLGLDIVVGSNSNENSSLSITGNAFLNGYLFVEAFDDETTFEVDNTYKIITVDGTRTGEFMFMPEGLVVGDAQCSLPELDFGLGWYIHYGDHEVTLTVKEAATEISAAHMAEIMPDSQRSLSVTGFVGAGYGYGYGSVHVNEWESGSITGSDSEGVTWTPYTDYPFTLTVGEGTALFEMFGQEVEYTYSGDFTDMFIRSFAGHSYTGASIWGLQLDEFSLGASVSATNSGSPAETIYRVSGMPDCFVLTGQIGMAFSTSSMPTGTLGFELIFGETDITPVTVTSSINTAGHVTLAWENLSSNTTVMEITRSDDGGNTWSSALYTTSSLTGSTYTDTTGDHVGSIYKVNQKEFTYGWLEVPTIVIPAANPTLTVNLNDSGDLDGVRFEMNETDPSLMNILVDDVLTAQFAAGRIGERHYRLAEYVRHALRMAA